MSNAGKRPLKVFLCHASGDKPPVRDLYKRLTIEGVDAWLDKERLLPGQDWRLEIPKAVQESDVVVICLSKKSVTKEGYVQKEIKFALDIAEEKPEGTIFLIPARLEDCTVPDRLSRWHWVDLYEENGFIQLLRSLKIRADAVGATVEPTSYVDSDKEIEHRLEELYTEGLAAFYTEDWDRACQRFQTILSERPSHRNATEKLEEAKRQRNLATLYEQAMSAVRSEDWDSAIQILEELSHKSADYKDTAQLLRNARKQEQLRELYAEAKALHAAQKWQAVVKVFEQISVIEPNFSDVNGLLPSAQKEVVKIKRIEELNSQYSHALREIDAGHLYEARRLLEQVHKSEIGFLETEGLLRKVEDAISKEEEKRRQNDEISTLYEQAHGLLRSKKWRKALDKMGEIRKLDDHFPDTDGIAEKAQKELAREEQEAERQNRLAAVYAEAVRLLKEEKYQEALAKWQEVKAVDPKYPDRQWVGRTAKRKLTETSKTPAKQHIHLPVVSKKYVPITSILVFLLLGMIGMFVYANQPPNFPTCSFVTGISDPLLMSSATSSSHVFVDGRITYPSEWADAKCYQVYLVEWVPGQGCVGNHSVGSSWFVKNDKQKLYFLIRIPKTNLTPNTVDLSYYYPTYSPITGWPNSDTMRIENGKPLDQFGWNDLSWRDDTSDKGTMDTRAATTQADQYHWFELSKPMNSRDKHDWDWKPGETVGTAIGGTLMIGFGGSLPAGAGNIYACRYIQLHIWK